MYSDFGILTISASVRVFALLAIAPRGRGATGPELATGAVHRKPISVAHAGGLIKRWTMGRANHSVTRDSRPRKRRGNKGLRMRRASRGFRPGACARGTPRR